MLFEPEQGTKNKKAQSIKVHITYDRKKPVKSEFRKPVRKILKRNNVVLQALELPVVMNLNPRSLYEKTDDLKLIIEQYQVDVVFVSESWERENLPLEQLIQIENFEIISTVKKRDFRGGNPALIINTEKYHVKKLCPDPITVPVGVEAIWALISPKTESYNAKVKRIDTFFIQTRVINGKIFPEPRVRSTSGEGKILPLITRVCMKNVILSYL